MTIENPKQKVNDYIHMYDQLKSSMRWKVFDKRILMMIASLYVVNNRELRIDRLLNLADEIKKHSSLFSSMRSYPSYTTAAMLDVNFENPNEQVKKLFAQYNQLKNAGFQSGTFTYLAASVMVINNDQSTDSTKTINRTKEIYDSMKKEHMFLTSQGDYPLATLLAFENGTVNELIGRMETFYNRLNQNAFLKGNDLQFLSHILSLDDAEDVNSLVNRSIHVYDAFVKASIKPKKMYYPVIGMLALLPYEEIDMNVITQIYEDLNSEIRWQKDMNLIMAVNFFTSEKLTYSNLTETSMYTTMETIMQAQQAAMMAAVAGATAASASSGGGS